VMQTLGKVDAVVTDPPYELLASGPGKSHFGMSLNKFDSKKYTDIVSGVDYFGLFDLFTLFCAPMNGFVFCSNKQISKLMGESERRGLSTTLLIWHKVNAAPFANGVWRGDIEYIVHFRGSGAQFIGNALEKTKVIPHPIVKDDAHPTVKPIPIIQRLIKNCSSYGKVIFDPFMGSGTTGVACVQLGRKFIGIELDETYFDIACRRISDELRRPRLDLGEPPQKQIQEDMGI
jgi:site-specific DNA-methyltransferase (adenine-specific)